MHIFTKRQILHLYPDLGDSALNDLVERGLVRSSVRSADGPGRPREYSFNDVVMAGIVLAAREWYHGYPPWLKDVARFLAEWDDLEVAREPLALIVTPGGIFPVRDHQLWILESGLEQPFRDSVILFPFVVRVQRYIQEAEAGDREECAA